MKRDESGGAVKARTMTRHIDILLVTLAIVLWVLWLAFSLFAHIVVELSPGALPDASPEPAIRDVIVQMHG